MIKTGRSEQTRGIIPIRHLLTSALRSNWSLRKRVFVGFLIALLTFSVYVGSAIYTSSIPGVMQHFGVSQVVATLGLSVFVFAYGLGPALIAPAQEVVSCSKFAQSLPSNPQDSAVVLRSLSCCSSSTATY